MTRPQPLADRPAQGLPYAAMLRGSVIPTLCSVPVIVLVLWSTRQARGGLAALLGVLAVVLFASAPYIMKRVINSSLPMILVGALAVFFGQVVLLGLVVLALLGADWMDGKAFGLSVLAVALVWQLSQVVAFIRLRKPRYDEPADEPAARSSLELESGRSR